MSEKENYYDQIKSIEFKIEKKYRIEQVLRLYSVMGILISIFALSYFLLLIFDINLTKDQTLALTFTAFGFLFSVISWSTLSFIKQRRKFELTNLQSIHEIYNLIEIWNELEITAKEKLDKQNIVYAKHSINSILESLKRFDLINETDFNILQKAKNVRNMLVHNNLNFNISSFNINEISNNLINIIDKLKI